MKPDLRIVTDEALADRERRLVLELETIGANRAHELLIALTAARDMALATAASKSAAVGVREFARKTALTLEPWVATLGSLIARA